MIVGLCERITAIVRSVTWVGFAALIVTVGMQVLARNVLQMPMIWTGDVAQLLFAWLIFLGAAIGLRAGVHYSVDVIPSGSQRLALLASGLSYGAGVLIALLLLIYGWQLATIRATATVQSIGISRFWMFLPIPVSGGLMLLYLIEMAVKFFDGTAKS